MNTHEAAPTALLREANEQLVLALATAQNLEEERLEYFDLILSAVSDAVVSTDSQNRLTTWNRAAETLYGWTAEEVIGLGDVDVTGATPPMQASSPWRQAHRTRDGHSITVEGTTLALLDDSRAPSGHVSVRRDVSHAVPRECERDRYDHTILSLEQRVPELESLKSDFLASMTHELRTPLNAILGFTRLMLDEAESGVCAPHNEAYLAMVVTAGEQLLASIDDILEVSRIEAGLSHLRRQTFDLRPVVEAAVRRIEPGATKKGLRVALVDAGALHLHTDPERLSRALSNLLTNAVKFTDAGSIEVGFRRTGGMVEIFVRDSGVGFGPNESRTLFEPFHQADMATSRRYDGIGLGLHLTRKILGLLGGTVHAASSPGHGSTFTIMLPAMTRRGPSTSLIH